LRSSSTCFFYKNKKGDSMNRPPFTRGLTVKREGPTVG
jgi:hypothetical protein